MINFTFTVWILIIPFLMFIFLGLLGHKIGPKLSGLLGTGALAVITALSYIAAYQYFFATPKTADTFKAILAVNSTWLQFSDKYISTVPAI